MYGSTTSFAVANIGRFCESTISMRRPVSVESMRICCLN